jgi:DHA2 family multidrug resistance protein-like MFS transporter
MELTAPAAKDGQKRATRREWVGLSVLSIACLLYSMDLSVLFLAIPSIVSELKPSPTELLWINDIYGFMVAGFLVTMGTLGDLKGRRRVLLWGAAAFGAASVLCALARSAESLIVARALLGIAGATIAPSTLSLIFNMFEDESERARAIGIWGTAFALGGTVGPVLGGVLLHWFHWGSVFLVNVPIMLALIVIGPRVLPEFKGEGSGSVDLPSVLLSLATVLPVVYGLKIVAAYGWRPDVLPALLVALAAGWLFRRRQQRIDHPLVDFALFRSARFNVALMANLSGIFFIFAIFMLQNQYLQQVLAMTPLEAGLWSVLPSLAYCVMSLKSHLVIERLGAERSVVRGLGLFACACLMMGIAAYSGSLFGILGASVVMALGFVPVVLTTTNLIVSAAPPERAGSASAISETSAEFGGALGVGLLGSLATFTYRTQMAETTAPAGARLAIGDAIELAGDAVPAWLGLAREAFSGAYAGVCLVAFAGLVLMSLAARRVYGTDAKP